MNDRDLQNLNFFNALIVFSLITLFGRLFMAVWRRSKLAAILLITVGPYLLVSLHSVEEELQYRVLCQIKPDQVACKR
ncbi:MAG: hypothetical protein LH679_22150 [Cyanobacteria bacterium CAN_BIN43]|nr:hypothetical protein [Cyanobacteria bacterium CAN_BIN43]